MKTRKVYLDEDERYPTTFVRKDGDAANEKFGTEVPQVLLDRLQECLDDLSQIETELEPYVRQCEENYEAYRKQSSAQFKPRDGRLEVTQGQGYVTKVVEG